MIAILILLCVIYLCYYLMEDHRGYYFLRRKKRTIEGFHNLHSTDSKKIDEKEENDICLDKKSQKICQNIKKILKRNKKISENFANK